MTDRRFDASWLRLVMITEGSADRERIVAAVTAAVAGGIRVVQVREHALSPTAHRDLCAELRATLDAVGGRLFVNDRVDVAESIGADGVHLGRRSVSPRTVRAASPALAVGVSAHSPAEILAARDGGADYVTLSPLHETSCKPGARALGFETARRWTAAAAIPVVWLGGIDASVISAIRAPVPGLVGFAVRGALAEPAVATHAAAALEAAVESWSAVQSSPEAEWTPSA